ncbi:hypothetical protein [Serratia marcescens]|uniref:hypothetical protein n=1 Tax=Serratia marcescens TaxID=615 RepID=UPI002FD9E0C4
MREPMSLDAAAHRAGLNVSLFEVILDMAVKEEIPAVLYDLISIACETNSEIRRALDKGVGNDA